MQWKFCTINVFGLDLRSMGVWTINWSSFWITLMKFAPQSMRHKMRQPVGTQCTFKSDSNLWLTSVYMFHPIVQNSLLAHKLYRSEPAWTPEPSIRLHCPRSIDSLSKGVFGSVLKLTFIMISFLCYMPMGFFVSHLQHIATDASMKYFLLSWFIYDSFSFSLQFSNNSRRVPQTARRRSRSSQNFRMETFRGNNRC